MEFSRDMLQNRVAVVTGGAGGIGSAVARTLAVHGAKVMAVDLCFDGVEALINELEAEGCALGYMRADITVPTDMEQLARYVMEEWGRIDVLVHAAGISGRPYGDGPVTECSEETWEHVLRTNLTGAYLVSRYLLPPMLEARSGSVIHIASDDAISIPPPPHDTHAYIAAKGGLIALTKAMAISYAPYGVRVNAVAPGWIETPMTADLKADPEDYQRLVARHPLGRMGTPQDIASACLFLASDAASFITGTVLPVEGGATVW